MIHRIRSLFLKHRFERLHSEDSTRVEESLAVARVFIVCAALLAIYVDPTEPSRFVVLGYSLLILNVLYSLALVAYLRSLSVVSARLQLYIHAVDVFWAALLSFFSQGPGSVFFAFFIVAVRLERQAYHAILAPTRFGCKPGGLPRLPNASKPHHLSATPHFLRLSAYQHV